MDNKSNFGQNNNIGNGNPSDTNIGQIATNQGMRNDNNQPNNIGNDPTKIDDILDSIFPNVGVSQGNDFNNQVPLQSASNKSGVGTIGGNTNLRSPVSPGIGPGFIAGQMQQTSQQIGSDGVHSGAGSASPEAIGYGASNELPSNIETSTENTVEKSVEELRKIEEVSSQLQQQKIKKQQVEQQKLDKTNSDEKPEASNKFDKVFGYPVPDNIARGEVHSTDPTEVATWLSFFVKRLEEMWAK